MKYNFTNSQIKELITIAETEEPGRVLNLSCFGKSGNANTRANRIERILPNVNTMVVLGDDGKFSPLTEQEKTDCIMKIFNDFWKRHLNFLSDHFEFIGGLQDDFFTNEIYNRLLDYARVFFANRIDAEIAGRNQFKYRLSTKTEVKMLETMNKAFPKSLYKKMKDVSKAYLRRKKEQDGKGISMLQELIANDLAWQDAQTLNADGSRREIDFKLD